MFILRCEQNVWLMSCKRQSCRTSFATLLTQNTFFNSWKNNKQWKLQRDKCLTYKFRICGKSIHIHTYHKSYPIMMQETLIITLCKTNKYVTFTDLIKICPISPQRLLYRCPKCIEIYDTFNFGRKYDIKKFTSVDSLLTVVIW